LQGQGFFLGPFFLCVENRLRIIHALFQAKMAGKAHGYCVKHLASPTKKALYRPQ
jgi:hypothetical protein